MGGGGCKLVGFCCEQNKKHTDDAAAAARARCGRAGCVGRGVCAIQAHKENPAISAPSTAQAAAAHAPSRTFTTPKQGTPANARVTKHLKPVVGWNTWCTQNKCTVDWCNEAEVLDVATYMKSNGFQQFYDYILLVCVGGAQPLCLRHALDARLTPISPPGRLLGCAQQPYGRDRGRPVAFSLGHGLVGVEGALLLHPSSSTPPLSLSLK